MSVCSSMQICMALRHHEEIATEWVQPLFSVFVIALEKLCRKL